MLHSANNSDTPQNGTKKDSSPLKVLMVAEKPSAAKAIARAFKWYKREAEIELTEREKERRRKQHDRRKKHGKAAESEPNLDPIKTTVYEFSGSFQRQDAQFKIIATYGNVTSSAFLEGSKRQDEDDEDYNWREYGSVEQFRKLFDVGRTKKKGDEMKDIHKFIASEADDCHAIVLWLDCDRAGEHIGFEVMEVVRKKWKQMAELNGQPVLSDEQFLERVFRAHFSSLTETAVRKAMASLQKPNKLQSEAMELRAKIDLMAGCLITRVLTLEMDDTFLGNRKDYRDYPVVSFGPCQTVILEICVERHEEILAAKKRTQSQKLRKLSATIALPDGSGELKLTWNGGEETDLQRVEQVRERIKTRFSWEGEGAEEAVLISVVDKEVRKEQPLALNTAELMRVACDHHKTTPFEAMNGMQEVYRRGMSTYCRTKASTYHKVYESEVRDALSQLKQNEDCGPFAKEIHPDDVKSRLVDAEGDCADYAHPPIMPTPLSDAKWAFFQAHTDPSDDDSADEIGKKHLQRDLYNYIVRHFCASLMTPCCFVERTATFKIGDEHFTFEGRTVRNQGFTSVLKERAIVEREMPNCFQEGAKFKIKGFETKKAELPKHLSFAELITEMEQRGIGTDATMANLIKKVFDQNQLELDAEDRLVPTAFGIALIRALRAIEPTLVDAGERAEFERRLTNVAKGNEEREKVEKELIQKWKGIFDTVVQRCAHLMHKHFSGIKRLSRRDIDLRLTKLAKERAARSGKNKLVQS